MALPCRVPGRRLLRSDLSAGSAANRPGRESGNVDTLMKLIAALEAVGVELINEGAISEKGGRGIRLKAR